MIAVLLSALATNFFLANANPAGDAKEPRRTAPATRVSRIPLGGTWVVLCTGGLYTA
jgi:hypothetical protein